MKKLAPAVLEIGRLLHGEYASDPGAMWGAFMIAGPKGRTLVIMSSGVDTDWNWEHVSVSVRGRNPTWDEMCYVKNLFWDEEECVIQYHPPKDRYVNYHPFCLHLWRPLNAAVPMPPQILIGPQGSTEDMKT
jgi:hypothetical protein